MKSPGEELTAALRYGSDAVGEWIIKNIYRYISDPELTEPLRHGVQYLMGILTKQIIMEHYNNNGGKADEQKRGQDI